MDLPLSRIISTVVAILFLVAVAFKTFLPGDDPYRCRAVQNTGRWIDLPDEQGNRYPFHQWQPDGCILHQYDSTDIRQCTEGRRIVVVGDSTSRHVAYAFGRLINRKQYEHDKNQASFPNLRDNVNLTYDGQMIQRLSNVWVGSHGNPLQEEGGFVQNLDIYADEKMDPPAIEDQEGPAIIYVAAGVWYTNHKGNTTRRVPWHTRFHIYKNRINKLSKFINHNTPHRDPFTAPMDPRDGIGNQIFYGPPSGPCYQGNHTRDIKSSARRTSEVADIHNWLRHTEHKRRIPILWSIVGVTLNQNKTWIDPLTKAMHVIDQVSEARANIVLNLRCNAKLDRIQGYHHTGTCCTDYGVSQYRIIIAVGIVYLSACVICEILHLLSVKEAPWTLLNMQTGSFVLVLLMCYFSDRTQMMAKSSKLWELDGFAILCAACLVSLLVTIRRTRPRCPEHLPLTEDETSGMLLPENCAPELEASPTAGGASETLVPEKFPSGEENSHQQDEPFLSRKQTEEWKGWMQCFVLIYQWTGAEQGPTSIYILFRLCIAAYIFQTGYGHTCYFISTGDFSFKRVASTLLRLNTLSCALTYLMKTDYMFYYSAPLASFWFLVIYATLAIGKEYNNDSQVLAAKVCVSGVLVSVMFVTPLTRWMLELFKIVFNIQWSADQWIYYATLDMYVVYIGMVTAIVNQRMANTQIILSLRLILVLAGLFATYCYFSKASTLSVSSYDSLHPYISCIPILVYITLRNISTCTRNYHSKAMAWLGCHSLEISILQCHILLAADREGVLSIDGLFGDGTVLGDRWRTLLIVVPIFLWVCYATRSATCYIIELMLKEASEEDELDEPAFAYLKELGISRISYPGLRLALIVLTMWLVNLLSPMKENMPLPSGTHDISVLPMPEYALDHPF
ncbi:10 TM acyl transferase domain found in Cas1p-domain-containing protein [Fusarium venenatum]|uniref:10 TM acyl transferase domain found in Cas1p-domain-containing protein n=1 Tax=Fusarium venenatum TaxID=56646 RepID=UPI001DEA261F|nr:10 TM acyl transferase domain found in Cas1p-domain-containing protein [Fusarium venenatum]